MISKITLKASERRHPTTTYLAEVTVQNHVWTVFLRIYTNLQSKVSLQFCFQVWPPVTSTIETYLCHFMRNHYQNIWLMKIQNLNTFLFLRKQPQNRHIFQFFTLYLKGCHFSITKLHVLIFCNILHIEMDFWNLSWKRIRFLRKSFGKILVKNTISEILKKIE